MTIQYPEKVFWRKTLSKDPLDNYGKSNRARIKSTLTKIENVSVEIEPVTEETLHWFIPLYETEIGNKDNPNLHDVRESAENAVRQMFALTLKENGTPIGGTLFTLRNDMLAISYRVYPNQWETQKLQANPSLYTDFVISKYAIEHGKTQLSHGVDRNLYGQSSSIGLAAFKLSVGCKPGTPKSAEILTLDANTITSETFVVTASQPGDFASSAHLFLSRNESEKWPQVTKYPELISVETHVF